MLRTPTPLTSSSRQTWKRETLASSAGMNWDAYFESRTSLAVGSSSGSRRVSVFRPLDREAIETWERLSAFHLSNTMRALYRVRRRRRSAFYGAGAQREPDREKVAIDAPTRDWPGSGQLYTQRISTRAKAKAKAMVAI